MKKPLQTRVRSGKKNKKITLVRPWKLLVLTHSGIDLFGKT